MSNSKISCLRFTLSPHSSRAEGSLRAGRVQNSARRLKIQLTNHGFTIVCDLDGACPILHEKREVINVLHRLSKIRRIDDENEKIDFLNRFKKPTKLQGQSTARNPISDTIQLPHRRARNDRPRNSFYTIRMQSRTKDEGRQECDGLTTTLGEEDNAQLISK
jgi:hypothetical protein